METPLPVSKGEEIGRFNMGSTVILLSGAGAVEWIDTLVAGTSVRMGQRVGTLGGLQ